MFNIYNPLKNGELTFYNTIKKNIKTIFDIGARSDSCFFSFNGEVHYFEPNIKFYNILKEKQVNNSKYYFNNFGLGNNNTKLYYYPRYQSFIDRTNSCKKSDEKNKIELSIKKGSTYVKDMHIDSIDFLKIDTEGFEFEVLKGFEDSLNIVNIIQFEYGGTYLDNNVKMIDIINYLKGKGFINFSYLSSTGVIPIEDFTDHYKYCNIVCYNKNSNYIPY